MGESPPGVPPGADAGLVLASASPRRFRLLVEAGFDLIVDPADVDETPDPGERPDLYVERLARAKASTVAARHPDSTVVGADTVVVLDGALLGKPVDAQDARAMLRRLSGRTHEVLTGVAVAGGSAEGRDLRSAVAATRVRFRVLDDAEIDAYVAGGEPMDKAGSYAIQGGGAAFVEDVDGPLDNVIGLPVELVRALAEVTGRS